MKLFRFMSRKEFLKYLNGKKLINNTKHEAFTDSVGFCFMKYGNPKYSYEYLMGIVDDEVCAVFETTKKLNKRYGKYADPCGSFFSTITEDEYCTTNYNNKDFKLIKFCLNVSSWNEWSWIKMGDKLCLDLMNNLM